jgi:hypothetical protein
MLAVHSIVHFLCPGTSLIGSSSVVAHAACEDGNGYASGAASEQDSGHFVGGGSRRHDIVNQEDVRTL